MEFTKIFIRIGIVVSLLSACVTKKNIVKANYPPVVSKLATTDTIWLNDWTIGDSSWKQFEFFSDEELINLTNHPKGPVKFFAIHHLLKKSYSNSSHEIDFFSILKKRLYDETPIVFTSQYTLPEKVTVGECYLQLICGYRFSSDILGTSYFFTSDPILQSQQINHIDSLLICNEPFYDESSLDFILRVASHSNIKPCVYDRILKNKIRSFTNTLALYQDPKDISMILENLPIDSLSIYQTKRWFPFSHFQHPRLFEFLKQNWKAHWRDNTFIYNVAKYQSKESAELLDKIYEEAKKDEKVFMYVTRTGRQIETYYTSAFADLYFKVLSENPENGNFYSWNHAAKIWEDRPEEIYALYLTWKIANTRNTLERIKVSFPYVIHYLEENDPKKVVDETMSFLKVSKDQYSYSYLFRKKIPYFIYIKKSKNFRFGAPLFQLFKKEQNGFARFFLSKFLIDVFDDQFEDQVKDFYLENPDLRPTTEEAEKGERMFIDFCFKYRQEK